MAAQDGFVTVSETAYPGVSVRQTGSVIAASSTGLSDVSWKYRLLDAGDFCGPRAFVSDSGYPWIQSANRLSLPDSYELLGLYRNRFVCFEATGVPVAFDSRETWSQYGVWRIDLGNPVISIRSESEGGRTYLQASSSESVAYEVLRYSHDPRQTGLGSAFADDGSRTAGGHCAYHLTGDAPGARTHWLDWVTFADADGRVLVGDPDYLYCFKAVDSDGNHAYLFATPSAGRVWTNQSYGRIRFGFSSTSGTVSYSVAGPLDSAACDSGVISGAEPGQRRAHYMRYTHTPRPDPAVDLAPGSAGKYYCFQATDQLGHSAYASLLVDLRPPRVTVVLEGDTLRLASDKPILNSWFVGPLAEDEFEHCADIFARDADGSRVNPLWWHRSERAEEIAVDPAADAGWYYCAGVEDYARNIGTVQFLLPGAPREDLERAEEIKRLKSDIIALRAMAENSECAVATSGSIGEALRDILNRLEGLDEAPLDLIGSDVRQLVDTVEEYLELCLLRLSEEFV